MDAPSATFTKHADWLNKMPWGLLGDESIQILESAMSTWIDEYNDTFNDQPTDKLSELIDRGDCSDRVLNLIGGLCKAFLRNPDQTQASYKKVSDVLKDQQQNPPANPRDGISRVRDVFRDYGNEDGVRQCILVSAVEAQQRRAKELLINELKKVTIYDGYSPQDPTVK